MAPPALPTNPTALWTARYRVTTSQRTRRLADHNLTGQPTPCRGVSVVWARAVDFGDKAISSLVAKCHSGEPHVVYSGSGRRYLS